MIIVSGRRYDYENFLSTLLLKNSVRTRALTIRAFNVEISRVQDQVSEKSIGLMRFQFWTDAIDKVLTEKSVENVPAHPIVQQLYKVILYSAVRSVIPKIRTRFFTFSDKFRK